MGQKVVQLRRQGNRKVPRSRSHCNLGRQINHCMQQIELKKKDGYKLIKFKDRPSKGKTVYNQNLQTGIRLEKLLDKRSDIFNNFNFYRQYFIRQQEFSST